MKIEIAPTRQGVLNEVAPPAQRLLSLDFMRGLIMVLLMLEACGLYEHLLERGEGTVLHAFFTQFTHHPWHGLRFWDLIQPGFMFIAGTALAYSLERQQRQGMPWRESLEKTLRRSGWLFFWGVLDYAVRPQGLSFELWDVLTQLSFTTLVTFLVFRWSGGAGGRLRPGFYDHPDHQTHCHLVVRAGLGRVVPARPGLPLLVDRH
jgi:predicted acyltransferase